MALAVYEFVVKIVVFAAKIVLRAMEFFAGLLFGGSTEETIREIGEMTDGEPGMVLQILSAIVYWSSVAVLLYLFVRLVISIIKWIPMKKSLTPEVIEESDMVEIRERIVKPKNDIKRRLKKPRKRGMRLKDIIRRKSGQRIFCFRKTRISGNSVPHMKRRDIRGGYPDDRILLCDIYSGFCFVGIICL